MSRRHGDLWDRRLDTLRFLRGIHLRRNLVGAIGAAMVTLLVVLLVVQLALSGTLSPADAAVVAVALIQLGSRLRDVSAAASVLHENALFLDELDQFVGREELPEPTRASTSEPLTVEVHDVSFRYPHTEHQVLRGVNLRIEPARWSCSWCSTSPPHRSTHGPSRTCSLGSDS